ncbi:uncharacterized protein LOC128864886 [Anastrepha ludens]|uniref:uncharacterized protein LOC128864886 n=1 Tax=Anastrepha ludens TaxID=28586 RepID=UPI0023AEF4A3|nr:uncharacterized protein LOC128864886 [Anastrepha ludens]
MKALIISAIFIGCVFIIAVHSKADFTNIKCIDFDKTLMYFDICLLKSVNRTYKYLTVRAQYPRHEPINNITVNFAMHRKVNGYKPFLYNITIDACQYLEKRNNPVIRYAHKFFEKYSTLNKSCPYGESYEMADKVPISYVTDVLPFPHGDYAYSVAFYYYKKKAGVITVYVTIS